ncbi:hypothetical protein EDC39_112100 [Geothermobacter ehrlichii]|uniref:Uncharacterized protein n=1 Tax=Geothermobacter ehrlichii TaxID=213224 RepID=A0A5D3WHL1_9BACT|nr:hypothetical protein [Geothermobacter ehrlichii]TYO96812.1 hypothetical protein EDC39_112100 [Geothermobacter ehrlichii]
MKRVRRFLLWSLVFLALLAGFDQLVLRMPAAGGPLQVVQSFYRDFRARLFALVSSGAPKSIDQVIDRAADTAEQAPAGLARKGPRYLYVDDRGTLQFADSLDDIPQSFRSSAQKLEK